MIPLCRAISAAGLLCVATLSGASAADSPLAPGRAAVLVTPNGPEDGGDFGAKTPGTKTAGLQEAIDYAKANKRDVQVAGGAMPKAFEGGAVYNLSETLRIPWMQDFRFDSGEAVLNYTGTTGDVVRMDSQMSCHYKFGLIVATMSDGTALHLKPETKGPDNFSVITTSIFEINALVGGGSVLPGEGVRGKGTGLWLDGSTGSIDSNKFTIAEIIACDLGVSLQDGTNNTIEVIDLHLCNRHMEVGGGEGHGAAFNRIAVTVNSHGIKGSEGVRIRGTNNLLTLTVHETAKEMNLIFDRGARDNLVQALALPGGFTNNAEVPTNRIVTAYPVGFAIETPAVGESGAAVVNRNPYTIEVMFLTEGKASGWSVIDARGAEQRVEGPIHAGGTVTLDPGDRIKIDYTQAPTWRWRAMR